MNFEENVVEISGETERLSVAPNETSFISASKETSVFVFDNPHQEQQPNKHPPLRRIIFPMCSSPADLQQHTRAPPAAFSSHSFLVATNSLQLPPHLQVQQQQHSPRPTFVATLKDLSQTPSASAGTAYSSLPDSCYSSCSEGDVSGGSGHLCLSREPSDGGNNRSPSAVAEDLRQRLSFSSQKSTDSGISAAVVVEDYQCLLEFVTRLGYSEQDLRIVLLKLGSSAQQDNVLNELVKLQKSRRSPARDQNTLTSSFPVGEITSICELVKMSQRPKLRPIVIDGSNIAMSYGPRDVFACRGIRECVSFFVERGHSDILVFVPQFRREKPRPDAPILDQHILFELENEKRLVWTPSRRINGRRIVCHDDRYIVKTAEDKSAVIVSNDEYRDLCKESPRFKAVVEQHLLMYSFVDGRFMPPDDPLGRKGPTLEQFLAMDPVPSPALRPCPYARKCTYGNKCKYYHPEKARIGANTRFLQQQQQDEFSKKALLAARPSMIAENEMRMRQQQHSPTDRGIRRNQLDVPYPQQQQHFNAATSGGGVGSHGAVGRTQSLTLNSAATEQQPAWPSSAAMYFPYPPPPVFPISPPNVEGSAGSAAATSDCSLMLQPPNQYMFTPSTAVWGESAFSVGPVPCIVPGTGFSFPTSCTRNFSSFPNASDATSERSSCTTPKSESCGLDRQKLHHLFSQIFSEAAVMAVLCANPNETDSQKLCQKIIAFQQGFADAETDDLARTTAKGALS